MNGLAGQLYVEENVLGREGFALEDGQFGLKDVPECD